MALFRQSKSRAALALTTCFGVPASPALMIKLQVRVTEATNGGACVRNVGSYPVAMFDQKNSQRWSELR